MEAVYVSTTCVSPFSCYMIATLLSASQTQNLSVEPKESSVEP